MTDLADDDNHRIKGTWHSTPSSALSPFTGNGSRWQHHPSRNPFHVACSPLSHPPPHTKYTATSQDTEPALGIGHHTVALSMSSGCTANHSDKHVKPGHPARSLPPHFEDYDDADHHVLYKTVEGVTKSSQDTKVSSLGIQTSLPTMGFGRQWAIDTSEKKMAIFHLKN